MILGAQFPAPAAGANRRAQPAVAPWLAPAVASLFVVLWSAWTALFNSAQFGDNIEQFNWAHSLELGYHKHPPLPTWLLGLVVRGLGPSRYWAYGLAAACVLATAWLTWSIARRLLGDSAASVAMLLWPLQLCFSARAQLYNHNTVLILLVAATVWCSLKAVERRAALGARRHAGWHAAWWVATGACAGLAVLSKYQALVPLGGLLFTLGWAGHLDSRRQGRGLALALLTMLALCLPHVVWVLEHDFTTLRYAATAVDSSGALQRVHGLVSFVANQLRMVFPMLLAIALTLLLARAAAGGPGAAVDAQRAGGAAGPVRSDARKWLIGLVWVPVGLLLLFDLGGVSLRNHWGVQTLQFLSLWVAWRWTQRGGVDLRRLARVAVAVQALGMVLYAAQQNDPRAHMSERRMDTLYPAQRLADTALARWRAATNCPLRFVAGDPFPAGLVSLYSGLAPPVFDSEHATPWIGRRDLQRDGAIYAADALEDFPAGVVRIERFALTPDERVSPAARTIYIGVLPPAADCP